MDRWLWVNFFRYVFRWRCIRCVLYRLEIAVFERGGSLWPKISGRRGCPPPTICARLDRPVNALQLCRWKFSNKETRIFYTENGKKSLLRPLWGLEATYAVHLRLIGKLVGHFLLVIIELFSLGAFVLSQFTRVTDRQTSLRSRRPRLHTMQRGKKYAAEIIRLSRCCGFYKLNLNTPPSLKATFFHSSYVRTLLRVSALSLPQFIAFRVWSTMYI